MWLHLFSLPYPARVGMVGSFAASVYATFQPGDWAGPVNTLLLIILAIIARRNGQEIGKVRADVSDAAQAAASAAKAAESAARIAREVGADRRRKELPPPGNKERRHTK